MTHIYIQTIKQPTLHYLTRSVRRRAATSKRPCTDWSRHFAGGRVTGNLLTGSLLGKKSRLRGRIRSVEKIAQAHANEAKPLLRVETDAFAQ